MTVQLVIDHNCLSEEQENPSLLDQLISCLKKDMLPTLLLSENHNLASIIQNQTGFDGVFDSPCDSEALDLAMGSLDQFNRVMILKDNMLTEFVKPY